MSNPNKEDTAAKTDACVSGNRSSEIDAFVDQFLSTMCEASRRRILELLALPNENGDGAALERRSSDIARSLGLSAATTSGHLKQLAASGLVAARREGTTIYYRISNYLLVKAFHELLGALDKEYANKLPPLPTPAQE